MHPDHRGRRRKCLRAGLLLGAVTAAVIGLIGFAHTPTGRPLLRYLPGMCSACPVGAGAEIARRDRDHLRDAALWWASGGVSARSRTAIGFRLGESSRGEVTAWAALLGVGCEQGHGGASLQCRRVPADATDIGLPLDLVTVQFDADDRVVSVDASHRTTDPELAASFVSRRAAEIEERSGDATNRRGEPSVGHLSGAPLAQARVEFRFADLRSTVVATNTGRGAYSLRETHQGITR